MGKYFEEFKVGDEFVTAARTLTEADLVRFAAFTGDYAANEFLGLVIASGLVNRLGLIEGTIRAFMGLTWHFIAPVSVGDTLSSRFTVSRTEAKPNLGGGLVFFEAKIVNARGEIVQEGEWVALLASRNSSGVGY